ncbi:MAG: glycosyltransferase family 39 protein, partial [Ethanoligenens sp.]
MNFLRKHWDKIALASILLLAALLSVWGIWNQGYSNEFYAAAVKSMTMNWKNFFFVSLDPGGWVTVDKPPVSLWAQAAFAKVFGFYGWSIILPQCLAAVGTVAIIQHVVRRHFGKIAGLISALVLALSPIFIVVSKTNNTDSILVFFMALATWAMMVAADKGKLRYLLLSVVLLGVAYNAKTLEAFLILPGLFAAYFFATNIKWRRRFIHLVIAAVVLAAVSLSWSIAVDLTPASERPYVDSSSTNSELELALGYNGIQRITGQSNGKSGGMGAQKSNAAGQMQAPSNMTGSTTVSGSTSTPNQSTMPSGGGFGGGNGAPEGGFSGGNGIPGGNAPGGKTGGFAGGMDGGGNSMFNGGGSASIIRMFNSTLGGQDSWLLPLGFFSILALLLGIRKSAEKDSETRKRRLRGLLVFGVSLLIMFAYFSVSSFFHAYYISVMCPFLAALVGIGIVEMWKLYRSKGLFSFLLPVAFAVTTIVQIILLTAYPSYAKVLIPFVIVFAGIPTAILFIAKFLRKEHLKKISMAAVSAVTVAGLLIAPAVWTIYSVASNSFN